MSLLHQPPIGVVLPQKKPVLGAGGKHPVWLLGTFIHQIIDEDANIPLGPFDHKGILALNKQSRVDSRNKSLPCRLLVSGRAVYLTGKEEAIDQFGLERKFYLVRGKEIVLDSIPRPQQLYVLKGGDCSKTFQLNLFGQTCRESVDIYRGGIVPFRLQKDLVALLLRKPVDFILNGGTVAGTYRLDPAGKHRRSIEPFPQRCVCAGICIGQIHRNEPICDFFGLERKRMGRLVACLLFGLGKINGAKVYPGRRTCL